MSVLLKRLAALAALALVFAAGAAAQLPESKGAPQVGDRAPDFVLPDAQANPVKLSDLYDADEGRWALLVFYRGYW